MGLQHGRYYPDPSNQTVYKDVPLQVDSNGKLIVTGTGGGGGGGDSITQAEVTLAIEDASNIDNLEAPLSSIATNTTGLNSLAKNAGAVDANTLRVALGSDDLAVSRLGATNETASTSDTATSGLNGRLQRIAQRISSLISLLPTNLGQQVAGNSFSVVASSRHEAASTPLAVRVSDGSAFQNAVQPATTRATRFVCLTTALTEGSFSLTNVRGFQIGNRSGVELRYSLVSGNIVNTPNFTRIPAAQTETSESGFFVSGTMYVSAVTVPASTTVSSTTTSGSSSVTTTANFNSVIIGQAVTGTGIPANTFVGSINAAGTTLGLCDATGAPVTATASGTTVTLTFSGAVVRLSTWS